MHKLLDKPYNTHTLLEGPRAKHLLLGEPYSMCKFLDEPHGMCNLKFIEHYFQDSQHCHAYKCVLAAMFSR